MTLSRDSQLRRRDLSPVSGARQNPSSAPPASRSASAGSLSASLVGLVAESDYPCLGARSVYSRDRATVRVLGELGTADAATRLRHQIGWFAQQTDITAGFASFVAVFREPAIHDEAHFEELLWRQLQLLHDGDDASWAAAVSPDPADPHFAFSVGGTPFFVVGLHPRASRRARRAPSPTLVFNLHEQFENLRRSEQYPRMRDTIRRRDVRFEGSVNPMVADHGSVSEARQYAGRTVGEQWRAPFVP